MQCNVIQELFNVECVSCDVKRFQSHVSLTSWQTWWASLHPFSYRYASLFCHFTNRAMMLFPKALWQLCVVQFSTSIFTLFQVLAYRAAMLSQSWHWILRDSCILFIPLKAYLVTRSIAFDTLSQCILYTYIHVYINLNAKINKCLCTF